MPVANITEARDLVVGMVTTAWATLMSPPPLFYDDQDENAPDTYAVATIRSGAAGQDSLGGTGGIRYGSEADLLVDIFTPFGAGMNAADAYIIVVQNAFRGIKTIPDKVWFQNVQVTEMGRSGKSKKVRVTVRFKYDELI